VPLSNFVCPLPNGHYRDPHDCRVFYHTIAFKTSPTAATADAITPSTLTPSRASRARRCPDARAKIKVTVTGVKVTSGMKVF
jgi:hypothetical protein